jgi:hypothetical protein
MAKSATALSVEKKSEVITYDGASDVSQQDTTAMPAKKSESPRVDLCIQYSFYDSVGTSCRDHKLLLNGITCPRVVPKIGFKVEKEFVDRLPPMKQKKVLLQNDRWLTVYQK